MAAPILSGDPKQDMQSLAAWAQSAEARLATLATPQGPTPLFATTKGALPAAGSFYNCAAFLADLGLVAVSNGAHWVNAGTGAVIA